MQDLSIMPPQDGGSIENTNLRLKIEQSLAGHRFSKTISKLIRDANMRDMMRAFGNLIFKNMEVQCNVLHAGMKN